MLLLTLLPSLLYLLGKLLLLLTLLPYLLYLLGKLLSQHQTLLALLLPFFLQFAIEWR